MAETLTYVSPGDAIKATRFNMISPQVITKSADFTISDGGTDGTEGGIETYALTNETTITLPTAADNTHRVLHFVNMDNAPKTIDGEGAETINGNASIFLMSKYDHATIQCDGTEWLYLSGRTHRATGYVNTADWTDRNFGAIELDYDNLTGTILIGDTMTASGGATGIVIADDGSTLMLVDVTGGGIVADDETLTFTGGATADANEPGGDNKDQDTDLYHGCNISHSNIAVRFLVSTDGIENNAIDTRYAVTAADEVQGLGKAQNTANAIFMHTATAGMVRITKSGTTVLLAAQDYYYNIIMEVIY